MGFVGADEKRKLLFGARNLGSVELVAYRWRWKPNPHQQQEGGDL